MRLGVALLTGIFLTSVAHAQPEASPRSVAMRVADRLVKETVFDFKPSLQRGEQEGFYTIDFFDSFGYDPGGLYYARSIIFIDSVAGSEQLERLALGISHAAGALKVTIDSAVVYSGSRPTDGTIKHLDYALVRPDTTLPIPLSSGTHRLSIKFAPTGRSGVVRIGLVYGDNELTFDHAHLQAPALTNAPEPIRFLVIGPFDADTMGVESPEGPDSEWLNLTLDYQGLGGRPVRWDIPRFHLVRDHPERLDYSDWRYFSGTFLDALWRVTQTFEGLDYTSYIDRHLAFFLDHRDLIARERLDYSLIESAFGHYFRGSLLDDMGMQAVPYADRQLDEKRRGQEIDDEQARLIRRVADYMYDSARRLPDGTLARLNPDSLTVWADDLFMASVILVRAATLFNHRPYLEEAVRQVELMHNHLNDPNSGLYWHGWFARSGMHSSSKWARANGWTMMAKTELLLNMDRNDPDFAAVVAIFQSHAAALLRVQGDDGRWHQVLDNPETYLETSATAMFVRAFAEGVRNGWLPKEGYLEAARRGWDALVRQVRPDGTVEGIVRGTPIFYSDDEYDGHPTRLNDPRGLGAVLYAAVAMEKLDRALDQK